MNLIKMLVLSFITLSSSVWALEEAHIFTASTSSSIDLYQIGNDYKTNFNVGTG